MEVDGMHVTMGAWGGSIYDGRASRHHTTICSAIATRRRLRVLYEDGGERILEPFCYGIGRDGQTLLRAWQVSGASRSGIDRGWKLLRVDWLRRAWRTDERYTGARPGYNPMDPAILCVDARI